MEGETDEPGSPKFEIITPKGRSNSSRGYTGPGIATYVVDEEGSTEKFAGEYIGGIRHGPGEYQFSDGSLFKGSYENNKKSGLGDATYKKREVNEDGMVTSTILDGVNSAPRREAHETGEAKYFGHFVEGARQTQGCMVYPNGDVYQGEWFAGQKHGEGSYRFSADGSVLSGHWVAGSLKRGRWILPTGAVFVGEFELNKPTGKGAWILPGGSQRREASSQGGSEEVAAEEEEGSGKYEIEQMQMRCICCVATRE
ncbi:uncharacterized protein EMH_0043350 [Eimeria mitis]|uniref:MORN repeat-containing protein n=1 Tax=Eimeria mitis TaxID=44415 RepID=U6K3J1_9EIME|nr:uncharacterized protein EMH_0043350 [Eimeria mitis]CDJ32305.1 hypothetical protein, conserved [Eimeria mitis]